MNSQFASFIIIIGKENNFLNNYVVVFVINTLRVFVLTKLVYAIPVGCWINKTTVKVLDITLQ